MKTRCPFYVNDPNYGNQGDCTLTVGHPEYHQHAGLSPSANWVSHTDLCVSPTDDGGMTVELESGGRDLILVYRCSPGSNCYVTVRWTEVDGTKGRCAGIAADARAVAQIIAWLHGEQELPEEGMEWAKMEWANKKENDKE